MRDLNEKHSARVRGLFAASWLAALCLLVGCAAKPVKPASLRAQFVVSADANPEASGGPSPTVVRLFQLSEEGAFASADFFAVYDKEKEVLGASLLSREEYVLTPGETRRVEIALNAQARHLGVLAAFRDIRSARWRAVTRAPEKTLTDMLGKDGITIGIEKDVVTMTVKD